VFTGKKRHGCGYLHARTRLPAPSSPHTLARLCEECGFGIEILTPGIPKCQHAFI
jgi:hypothetical protein